MPPKLFTLEQANALIGALQATVERLQPMALEAREKHAELQGLVQEASSANGQNIQRQADAVVLRAEIESLVKQIGQGIEEIQSHGCEVKDLESGLVDFRSFREDRVVYLCWHLGETEITAWHELDAGFSGRQPI